MANFTKQELQEILTYELSRGCTVQELKDNKDEMDPEVYVFLMNSISQHEFYRTSRGMMI